MTQDGNGSGNAKGESRSTAAGSPDDAATIAGLERKIAFLEKKLQIVGSITRHDVLNQLTAIIGYNELLMMMSKEPKSREYLEKEQAALSRIQRQFQFAKEYQNIAAEPPRWHNIRLTVKHAAEAINVQNVKILADTGMVAVMADPLLVRVLVHIFDNALRHGGTVTGIRVSFQQQETIGLLIIENDGTGIPASDKEKIFERGYGKGTGWGLFLAREILAVTGMTIRETGEEGKGVRIEIAMPPGSFRTDGEAPPAV